MRQTITVRTRKRCELAEVTEAVESIVAQSGAASGLCVVYCPHTTAGVCVNENADPDVRADVAAFLERLIPEGGAPVLPRPFDHNEGNSDSHIKSILTGPSVTLIIENGRLALGRWQGVYLAEFDGPRTREMWVKVMGE